MGLRGGGWVPKLFYLRPDSYVCLVWSKIIIMITIIIIRRKIRRKIRTTIITVQYSSL
jgi:hypothetical protein